MEIEWNKAGWKAAKRCKEWEEKCHSKTAGQNQKMPDRALRLRVGYNLPLQNEWSKSKNAHQEIQTED